MITLAQHLAAHHYRTYHRDCTCGERWHALHENYDTRIAQHAAHVAATWTQARTIATIDQLDALPVGTVVRDHETDIMVSGPTGEGESAWWYDGDPYRANEVDLPALVVWTPADGGDQ